MSHRGVFSSRPLERAELDGIRATVMGLGRFGGGRGLTEFLVASGAEVTVTDLKSEDALHSSIDALRGLPIRWVLGEHREDEFRRADVIFVNPAVPPDLPILEECASRGVRVESEMNLFFKLCRGHILGVTGSNGKTTTTSLTATMLRDHRPSTRIGGNLGISLLNEVDKIEPDDWVVLELSSFQLEALAPVERRPEISLVTNLSPNHLNRHGTYASYVGAKRIIVEGSGVAVLNGEDPVLRGWARSTARDVTFYGRSNDVVPSAPGVWFDGARVARSGPGERALRDGRTLFRRDDLRLAGSFNAVNAAGAAAAAMAAGCAPGNVLEAVRGFEPIEHRLERVLEHEGITYYNDSIATTPESTLCAIDALGPRLVLIAGGSDKGSSFTALGRAIARGTRGVVLIGETAPSIEVAVRAGNGSARVERAGTLEAAVRRARELATAGDRIALSPACASFGMFEHFAERGERFKQIVTRIARPDSGI